MRKVNLIVLALVAIYLLAASLVSGQGGKGGNVEQTIKALTEQWRQALLKDDAAAYDKLTAEDFITIGTAGKSFTKTEIVELLKSGKLKYEAYDYSDIKVRVYGDTALVNCTLNQKGRIGDRDLVAGPFLVVLVWAKRKGQWQTVSWQATRQLPQP
jgi:ketosteroid isomerase-like protein